MARQANRRGLSSGNAPGVELAAEIAEQDEAGRAGDESCYRMDRGLGADFSYSEFGKIHGQHRLVIIQRTNLVGCLGGR